MSVYKKCCPFFSDSTFPEFLTEQRTLISPGGISKDTILEKHRFVSQFCRDAAAGFHPFEIIRQEHGVKGERILLMTDGFQHIRPIIRILKTDFFLDFFRRINIKAEKALGKKQIMIIIIITAFQQHVPGDILFIEEADITTALIQRFHSSINDKTV